MGDERWMGYELLVAFCVSRRAGAGEGTDVGPNASLALAACGLGASRAERKVVRVFVRLT